MSPAKKRRALLGKTGGLGDRQRVYAIAAGLEIDELDGYEVTRKRVFYDDVLLVTYHRYFGWGFLLFVALAGAAFSLAGFAFWSDGEEPAAIVFLLFSAPFWLAFLLRVIFRVDVVTVFGKRTRAQMRFWFRKARARRVFDLICERTRLRQEEATADER